MQFDRSLDPQAAASPRPLTLAYLNSRFETGIRSPLDAAILQQPVDWTSRATRKLDEIPFDFERRRLSVVVEAPDGAGRRLLITKGAPEADPRPVHGVRSRRSGRAARRGREARVRGGARSR